ncbi:tRNA (guanosine(37)-N1)-methyltransferase TrmD [uncultured Paracoccus sp.]|uniref:tRNA (guanosine(37)-N1)-methyltransferase TrmD n=1 Tax=uncultured Paracoccus sp. TaxID=189685 RepID=UPI0025E2CD6A|nr:tRNA (guanosine(37)-N1)-methyltransferase TrmD [uncultured Paracoccus sp.]
MTAPRSHGRIAVRLSSQPSDLMGPPEVAGAWTAQVVTLFPEAFPGVLGLSLTGRALSQGLWNLRTVDLRPFGEGRHRNVDDTPAGGGAGMVIRADVMARALDEAAAGAAGRALPVIYLSPRGRPLTQARARQLAQGPGVTLICGRFEGVDQRVLDAYGVEEISIGDYVLTGGELAAQVLIDATVRLIPRVLGNQDSLAEESFSPDNGGLLEHPQYTKPAHWEGRAIPEVLLSGNHAAIAGWRRDMAERLTKERRPDLWRAYEQTRMDPAKDRQLSGASDQSRDRREHEKD